MDSEAMEKMEFHYEIAKDFLEEVRGSLGAVGPNISVFHHAGLVAWGCGV